MKRFNIPYYFYVFAVIGKTKKNRHIKYYKLGFSKKPRKRVEKEWKAELKKKLKENGGLDSDYDIIFVCEIQGVFYNENDESYILVGSKNQYVERRDSCVRKYLYDKGVTSRIDCNIMLPTDNGNQFQLSIEGIDFIEDVDDNKVIEYLKEFESLVRRGELKEYSYKLTKNEYKEFEDCLKNNSSYVNYKIKRFYKYIEDRFGYSLNLEFLHYAHSVCTVCGIEPDIDILFSEYIKIVDCKKIKNLFDKYREFSKNYRYNEIKKCIENWLRGNIKDDYEGIPLF